MTKRIVVIEGEDAAPEAVRPTVQLVNQLGLDIEWLHPPVGEEGLARCGSLFPDECRAAIDTSDATLFGATSGKSVPALFYLRWGKRTYANVRPARWMPGCRSPMARPDGHRLRHRARESRGSVRRRRRRSRSAAPARTYESNGARCRRRHGARPVRAQSDHRSTALSASCVSASSWHGAARRGGGRAR